MIVFFVLRNKNVNFCIKIFSFKFMKLIIRSEF